MRRIHRGQLLRNFTLLSVLLCAAAWTWSYHRPAGINRAGGGDMWVAGSDRGSIVVARISGRYFLVPLVPRWAMFFQECDVSDWGTLAKAWLGRCPLGFGFGMERVPAPESTWTLDQNGYPVQTGWVINPSKHRQFVAVIPWWSVTAAMFLLTVLVWRRTRQQRAAFPIQSASEDKSAARA